MVAPKPYSRKAGILVRAVAIVVLQFFEESSTQHTLTFAVDEDACDGLCLWHIGAWYRGKP